MSAPAISAADLTFRYGDITAVDNISFEVSPGEIFGFLGPNGAGKSTTVKMLTGQLRPQTGSVHLLGRDITRHTNALQGRIGVCFENANLYEQMTGVENLRLFARLFGVSGFDAGGLLRRVGLDGRGHDRVETYSKGMKQRLMVARTLVNTPDILFLDEPTEGLDPASAAAIRNIIREEQGRGATIFLTTHDMLEADKLSNRVAFIDRGHIVALDTPHNLKQAHGKRLLRAEVIGDNDTLVTKEVILDRPDTPADVAALFEGERVVTVHSEEATLEDIFIRITGRELT